MSLDLLPHQLVDLDHPFVLGGADGLIRDLSEPLVVFAHEGQELAKELDAGGVLALAVLLALIFELLKVPLDELQALVVQWILQPCLWSYFFTHCKRDKFIND